MITRVVFENCKGILRKVKHRVEILITQKKQQKTKQNIKSFCPNYPNFFPQQCHHLHEYCGKTSIDEMKVVIKEWNAVSTWKWNTPDDEVCGICRVQFDGTCPKCKYPGDDCPLSKYDTKTTLRCF